LRGASCAIGYQQRQIWFLAAFYLQTYISALLAAVALRQPNTYFYHVVFLDLFGL
jgi:hypothetical protein